MEARIDESAVSATAKLHVKVCISCTAIDKDGHIALTDEGLTLSRKIYERHTVLSRVLMLLGVDEETASEDACRIEHVISDKSFESLKKHLEEKI